MAEKKITMHRKTTTGYDDVYPKTVIEQVDGLQTALNEKQDDLTEIQSFANNKYLHSNSSTGALEWADADALPPQAGQSGKYLTTDGSVASWAAVQSGTLTRATHTIVAGEESSFTSPLTITNINRTVVYHNGILLTYNENYTVLNNVITLVGYTAEVGDIFTVVTNSDDGLVVKSNTFVASLVGPGSYDPTTDTTSFIATHNFNTKNLLIQVYDNDTSETVICDTVRADNTTTFIFNGTIAAGKTYKGVIMAQSYITVQNAEETRY